MLNTFSQVIVTALRIHGNHETNRMTFKINFLWHKSDSSLKKQIGMYYMKYESTMTYISEHVFTISQPTHIIYWLTCKFSRQSHRPEPQAVHGRIRICQHSWGRSLLENYNIHLTFIIGVSNDSPSVLYVMFDTCHVILLFWHRWVLVTPRVYLEKGKFFKYNVCKASSWTLIRFIPFIFNFVSTFYWPVSLFHWASRLWEVSDSRLLSWWGVIKLLRLLCGRTIELLGLLCRRTVKLLRWVAVRLLRRTEELRRGTILPGHSVMWGAPCAASAVPVVSLGPVVAGCEKGLGQKHCHVGSGSHPGELCLL